MTRQPFRFTLLFLLICLTLPLSTTAQVVDIPDANLRAAIEAQLGKASGATITVADMANLTRLEAANANIADLTGLEHATNLQSLRLDGQEVRPGVWENSNSVSDLSPLAGLTQLEELDLWRNSVSDISALAGLINLTHLGLVLNSISDISPVAGLTNLKRLFLDATTTSDISALAGLTNLMYLGLDGNSISDISALAGLTNLTWMRIVRNSISDLSPLVANTGLGEGDWIDVQRNPLNYASIKTHLPALKGRGIEVYFDNRIPITLWKISGVVTVSDNILIVEARGSDNLPFAGVPVTFTITSGGGTLSVTSTTTDETGRAQTTLTLGSTGEPNNVKATAADSQQTVTFSDVAEPSVDIPDPNLRAAIESTLGKASGAPITTVDMARLTHLRAPNRNITNLTGLETATNLTFLDLGLERVEGVSSNSNSVSDLSPLAGLTNLTELTLTANSISDISHLSGLTNLTFLALGVNSISDISPVVGLTNLTILSFGNNSISDISPVAGLTNLTDLSFWRNSISDISPVARLTNLTYLSFGSNSISDISPVEELTNLTHLWAGGNPIVDISPVAKLTNLTGLGLWSSSISDISAIAGLTNLTFLLLDNNSITDLSPLVENMGLGEGDTVQVTRNFLNALSINTHIPALESRGVEVRSDNIVVQPEDIAQAADIPDPNLRTAIENERGKPAGATITVADMLILAQLVAFNANISDLTGLEGATNLKFLILEGNSISDISPLAGLTNLKVLVLRNNSISDISPLVENMGLGDGDFVDVSANPVSVLSIYTHIRTLQSRGVEVGYDPQEPDLLSGHNDGVVSVAFSRDGTLTSGSHDGTVILWDAATQQPIATLTEHTASARSVAFSPDGSILASGSHDGTVILWDVATQQPKDTLTEHTASVEAVAFSPDGTLASGSHDGTIILWDIATGQPKDTIIGHANWVWSLAFSADGTLAIGRNDGTILLWDVANRQPKDTLIGHTAWVESVAFNRDGSTLASGSGDNTVRLWEVATGRTKAILPGHARGINSVAFNPDGTLLASGSDDRTVRLWDAVAGQPIITLTGHMSWVRSVAFSPDGSTLASGSGDRTVRLWEIGLPALPEFTLSLSAGYSLIHVPLKVTEVDGVAQTITSIGDLYDALGGVNVVKLLLTLDSQTQEWFVYLSPSDRGTPNDRALTDDMGIIVEMKVPKQVRLTGNPLGTNGSSTITLNPELNLVGLPLNDSRITRVSDLFELDGIGGNVPVIILTEGGEFKLVGQPDDPGDIEITGGQAFIMTASQETSVNISGDAWANEAGTAAAPPVTLKGVEVGDTTLVLGLRGVVVDEGTGLNNGDFRVTAKNLSTGKAVTAVTAPDEAGYQLTVVDIETGRAATVGDILEISARSPNPFVGVEPLRYTVTAEDVKQSLIQLPELVIYEIPAETELLRNYPNPFNPETWIPYRLAEDTLVILTIYDLNGQVVRTIDVGHQTAAVYESRSKAVYWDGRNGLGEQVASGVYFYHLSAGDYSATRKMVILK